MRSFWSDPYLWVHLAGAAAVPLFLELCLLGLGVGSPLRPLGLEFAVVGAIGIAPVLWMQWQKPFSIFSLVILSLKPDRLTIEQRRILKLFKAPLERVLAVLTAIALLAVLWQLYQIAPIASEVTPFGRFGRLGGISVAAIAFLGCNLFLQIPISVLRVLLTSEKQFSTTEPYAIEKIAQDFTLLGLPVSWILPTIKAETKTETKAETEAEVIARAEAKPEPEAKPEMEAAEPREELAIAAAVTAVTIAPIAPAVDSFVDPLVGSSEIVDPLEEFEDPKGSEVEAFAGSVVEPMVEPMVEPVVALTAEATANVVDSVDSVDSVAAIDELVEADLVEDLAEADFAEDQSESGDSSDQDFPAQDQSLIAPETVLETANLAQPISETIHIIELELIEDTDLEEPYAEVIVVGEDIIAEEDIIAGEAAIEAMTIDVEIQAIPENITTHALAEGTIAETANREDDDWGEE